MNLKTIVQNYSLYSSPFWISPQNLVSLYHKTFVLYIVEIHNTKIWMILPKEICWCLKYQVFQQKQIVKS